VSRINPTLRGFLIIIAIAAAIVVLHQQTTLFALFIIARIAFVLAIAFFLYLLWRDHKNEISVWPDRAKWVFYGAAAMMVADVLVLTLVRETGLDAVVFVLVLGAGLYSMWRVWRDQHTYA
jgi:hypothetical protein